MKKNTTAQQASAIVAVIKVRQQTSDLHKHYQREQALEKKQAAKEINWMQQESYGYGLSRLDVNDWAT